MDWKHRPPVLVGEKVLWSGKFLTKPESGVVKWIGSIPEISSDWLVGIQLDKALPRLAGDGFWKGRKLFECPPNQGLLVPAEEVKKFSLKPYYKQLKAENDSHFKLDDTQIENFTRLDHLYKENKNRSKIRYSYAESKPTEDRSFDSNIKSNKENRSSTFRGDLADKVKFKQKLKDGKISTQKNESVKRNDRQPEKVSSTNFSSIHVGTDSTFNSVLENSEIFHSEINLNEVVKNMNEIAGYFKEIKEGDERFEKERQTESSGLYDANEQSHSKPKKLFSFLKWFNKKHKNEPNLTLFKDSSAASSPMFKRKETCSCESIDTLFSTQTVRSFAYIPPTQYIPSAPPLDYDKSSYENVVDITKDKNRSDEIESVYERRKKRKAPEPPRLSRENSLPTTLEHKKPDEDFDGVKTYHRRTVSESFKDKKAGAYCHVQGKKKAPPPPGAPLYPNLQKLNNQYPSLYKKKKPAPPPPDFTSANQNQMKTISQNEYKASPQMNETKKQFVKDTKDTKNEEKEIKINDTSRGLFTKDASLSPLPSRPWYKRSHRDSTGSSILRKDLLKGFDKKKNKEPDDWMPEVGFPRRSLSTESSHNKFNIFSKLEKAEEKKKEEKRKSQISILTNISELDREAAEIVRKEQAEEKRMMAANDAKYYLSNKNDEKHHEISDFASTIFTDDLKNNNKNMHEKKEAKSEKLEEKSKNQKAEKIREPQAVIDRASTANLKTEKDSDVKVKQSTIKEEKLKDKENNLDPEAQSNGNPKENLFSPNVLTDLTNSSETPLRKIPKSNENSSQSRLNYFNVQNKELNYLNEPWVCQKCTLENPGWRVFCEICASVKPRFPLNKTQPQAQKETAKSETVSEIEKPTEINSMIGKNDQITVTADTKNEKEKAPTETLDDLRKKRMNFFNSKLDTLSELKKNECEQLSGDTDEVKTSKASKEMKDNLSSNYEENKDNSNINKNVNKEILKEKSNEKKNASFEYNVEKKKEKEEEDKQSTSKENLQDKLGLVHNKNNNYSKQETPPSNEPEKVAEAYIITKTIVLEDIIVKKPERGKKVSSSVQTKSSPEMEVVRPPPRTKKITFDNTDQIEKEPGNDFQKEKTYSQKELEELTQRLTQAEGVADFRANIQTMPLNSEMNTVAVNRLLRKLETAINCGDHFVAAGLAKELALMKINCSVTRQVANSPSTSKINIDLYIEDKISHQGPIPLEISPTMSLLQLKKKVQQELGIPIEVQRWILGKKLATDDNKTLEAEGVKTDHSALFLYLVAPDNRKTNKQTPAKVETELEQKPQDLQPREGPKTKGWYYNYEEDHYSYCEDSEDESTNSKVHLTEKTTKIASEKENPIKISGNKLKNTETKSEINGEEKSPVFDLKSGSTENDAEKELKFIPVNSVKQKVEQLNKTFAENAKAAKPPLRSSRSPENWKCNACNVVNTPIRLNCFSCNAKKVLVGPNNRKIAEQQDITQKEQKEKIPNLIGSDNMHYKTLVELQDADLVPNNEPFNCSICMVDYAPGEGVTLKDCLHTFCRTCLIGTVQYSEDAEVKCPYLDETYSCPSVLQQREIKALVPQKIFELHLAKSVKEAENKIENAFHCKTPDCKGWCIYEDNVNEFRCPVCRSTNCLTCQAIHTGINCREYQERMKDASETDVDAKKTRDMLNEMVEKGEALSCPKCQVVLMKKWGCDWLRCSMCKTEICWVTKGFRWGPEGKGDTSGGCKCGVNGVKCHPKCNYCH